MAQTQIRRALVTGASAGIGRAYAEQLAARGAELVLTGRNEQNLTDVAAGIRAKTGIEPEIIVADLADPAGVARIEARLLGAPAIDTLVNNAGVAALTPLAASDPDEMTKMIAINVTALTRLTLAVAPRFEAAGAGTIINVASVVGITPESLNGVYGATKAYVNALTHSLQAELAPKGVRIQAVLPGATATELWASAGKPVEELPPEIVMSTHDMVAASLVGLDLGEVFTIPALPNIADWNAYEAAREVLRPQLSRREPAARYAAVHA